jgi:hypothetical protein
MATIMQPIQRTADISDPIYMVGIGPFVVNPHPLLPAPNVLPNGTQSEFSNTLPSWFLAP